MKPQALEPESSGSAGPAPVPEPTATPADVPAGRGNTGRTLERRLRRGLARVLVGALRPRPVDPRQLAAAGIGHLLVIRQHNQMGDMVLGLPALRALRRAYPRAHLTFVTGPMCEALLQGHPDIDRLVVYRKQEMWRPWSLWAFVRGLRRPRPDLAVVLGAVSFSTTSALLAWASGARVRVGVTSRPFGSELSRALYHFELPLGAEILHEVEHNLAPLRSLGLVAPVEPPVLVPRPDAVERARTFLEAAFAAEGVTDGARRPVVVVHAGAGKRANIWPPQHFASVARTLVAAHGARVVLTEGPHDVGIVSTLIDRLPGAARWRAGLGDTLGLLALADLCIANDTGMAHVAAAVGAPTVVVFGPTDARRWAPAGKRVRAVLSRTGRIEDANVADVLDAARSLLCTDV